MKDLLSAMAARLLRAVDWLDGAAGIPKAARESGQATIEFVILVPIFLIMFFSSIESSVFMYRQIALEQAVDGATRNVRLDGSSSITAAALRLDICDRMSQRADCTDNLIVEMIEIDMDTYTLPDRAQPCLVRDDAGALIQDGLVRDANGRLVSDPTAPGFVTDRPSRLILMRACYAARPILPLAGLGADLINARDGQTMSIVTTTAFRVEPV